MLRLYVEVTIIIAALCVVGLYLYHCTVNWSLLDCTFQEQTIVVVWSGHLYIVLILLLATTCTLLL